MFSHAQRALLIIASINGKHRVKNVETSKRDIAESILCQKSGRALNGPEGPAMTALCKGNRLL